MCAWPRYGPARAACRKFSQSPVRFGVKRIFGASSINQNIGIKRDHEDWGFTALMGFMALGGINLRLVVFIGRIESSTGAELMNG